MDLPEAFMTTIQKNTCTPYRITTLTNRDNTMNLSEEHCAPTGRTPHTFRENTLYLLVEYHVGTCQRNTMNQRIENHATTVKTSDSYHKNVTCQPEE
jgi:hypothetical protein